jgi:CheY-like chemotaxis protein/two-component sensor histidine kinase
MVKSILNGGNLLLSLLNDILDLSKIEAGKLEISPQPVDLSNLLQEILSLFSEKANTKGIEIRYFTSSDFPNAIMLDEIRVKQIMFNLIGNAIKFTPKGHVFIKLSYKPSTNHSGQLIIEVEDTGIGIPESQFEMIFEAFRQQSGQSNREFVGTGLGLAISKRLIEKMDGTIAVKSEVGKGSTFQLVFPEIETSPVLTPIKDEYASVSDIIFEQAIILVIDDVLSNIEAVENLLASTPLSIHSALSGEIGIEILKHMHPDLILLDMRLPGIDGYEVSRMIKKEPTLKDIPLIAYTASVSSISKIESSSDFDDFLYKPIKRNDLFAILKKFLKYKIDESINQHTMTSNTENLIIRAELPEELPKVLEILNDRFVPEWSKIKDTLILFKIAHFADDLKKMAIEYKFNYLINYSGKMKEYVDMIEIESIRAQLYKFPDIIEKLKQLSNT